MTFIKKTPFTAVAIAVFFFSRIIIIRYFHDHISDVHYYLDVATDGWIKGQKAYQDYLWGYPPLSLSIVYLPFAFAKQFDSYRFAFQLCSFWIDCVLVTYLAKFLAERLKLSANRVTVGVCAYSLLALFQGHLIYDRIDVFMVGTFVVALYYMGDPVLSKSMGAGVLGILWKVMPVFWMPVLGVMRWYEKDKKAFIKSALIGFFPTAAFLIGWDSYVNGHMFEMLGIHNDRGIQVESVWASIFMVWKVLNPSAAIEVVSNYGAQHMAGADVPNWVVSLSKVFGFFVMGAFYVHFVRRIFKIKNSRRAKTFNYYIGGYLAMAVPYLLFVATQRVLSTQYFEWSLPAVAILLALRPRWIDFVSVTLIYAFTSVEFDGITLSGRYIGYWDYVKFNPLITYDMALRNILLVFFVVRFVLIYRDYFSDSPKYFGETATIGGKILEQNKK